MPEINPRESIGKYAVVVGINTYVVSKKEAARVLEAAREFVEQSRFDLSERAKKVAHAVESGRITAEEGRQHVEALRRRLEDPEYKLPELSGEHTGRHVVLVGMRTVLVKDRNAAQILKRANDWTREGKFDVAKRIENLAARVEYGKITAEEGKQQLKAMLEDPEHKLPDLPGEPGKKDTSAGPFFYYDPKVKGQDE